MFGFKKKTKEQPQKKEPEVLKECSFIQSKGFRGYKRNSMTVYGVAEFPKVAPEVSGKNITFKQVKNEFGDLSWKVYLEDVHIGSLFDDGAERFNNDMVDAVYIKYEPEIVNGESRIRPLLFVHLKE